MKNKMMEAFVEAFVKGNTEVKMYGYIISGYYFANDERKHFEKIVKAEDDIEAMKKVIGELAWHESLEGNTFKLDFIHYDCWD